MGNIERLQEWLFLRESIAAAQASPPRNEVARQRARALAAASDLLASPSIAARHQVVLAQELAVESVRHGLATRDDLEVLPSAEAALQELELEPASPRESLVRTARVLALTGDVAVMVDRLRAVRTARLLALTVVAAATFLASLLGVAAWHQRKDLARGKPWIASSSMVTCEPALNSCGSAHTDILFHTKDEDSPWFRIDLGSVQRVSKVEVNNRRDCCPDRALPLVVETSTDGQQWKVVASRTESFFEWTATFPAQDARYVRARVTRHTVLHLRGMRVW